MIFKCSWMKNSGIIGLLLIGIASWIASCDYQPFRQGEILYGNFCAGCHGDNGEGFRDLYPPVANSDYFREHQLAVACMVQQGMDKAIVVNGKTYEQPMAPIPQLNAVEICNIINFLSYNWNTGMKTLKIEEVKEQLKNCKSN